MLKWFLHRQIAAFERTWNYDAGYIHEMIDVDPRAVLAFGKVQALGGYRKGVPPAVHFAAGIVAVMAEDCGPCTQLGIEMAEREGVDPACCAPSSRATSPPCPMRWRWRYASPKRHCATRPEADDLREEVVRQFGKRGLIALVLRHDGGAVISHAEIRARSRPRLHAALHRRRERGRCCAT